MPIIKIEDHNIQATFGKGDILIGAGMTEDFTQGLVTLVQSTPKPIGEYTKHEDPYIDLQQVPVSLIFENVESLDVLVERLKTTRKYMTGELDIQKEIERR